MIGIGRQINQDTGVNDSIARANAESRWVTIDDFELRCSIGTVKQESVAPTNRLVR
jgi:hypothetical protein